MYKRISKTFGDWADGKDEAHKLYASQPEKGVIYIVDVTTEEEYEENYHRDEWAGWTYIADAEGMLQLEEKFYSVAEFDSVGLAPDEVEG